jgi:hypothetical protein
VLFFDLQGEMSAGGRPGGGAAVEGGEGWEVGGGRCGKHLHPILQLAAEYLAVAQYAQCQLLVRTNNRIACIDHETCIWETKRGHLPSISNSGTMSSAELFKFGEEDGLVFAARGVVG